jgi:large subunit ribosomal protein L21
MKEEKKEKDAVPKNTKFAVIATGGKQYVVREGEKIRTEILADKNEGDSIEFEEVLLVSDKDVSLGSPVVSGKVVKGTVEKIGKAKKIDVLRFKAKSRHHRRYGHRQHFADVVIDSIA